MTQTLNIYALSRIHKESLFNIVEPHESMKEVKHHTPSHEMGSLRDISDAFISEGLSVTDLDGFYYGYIIPHIGKEFDLLKFTEDSILSVELKSRSPGESEIKDQLIKNRHYLSHIGRKIELYTVVTRDMTTYRLNDEGILEPVEFRIVADAVRRHKNYTDDIDKVFKPSEYLVSPISTPEKFIKGQYFLTQAQETVKTKLLDDIHKCTDVGFFNLTGKPGTGKTLLIYDAAKHMTIHGKTAIIHCGRLSEGQKVISREIENLDILTPVNLLLNDVPLNEYKYIFIDEAHRLFNERFDNLIKCVNENGQICVFSQDPEQMFSQKEIERDISSKISGLNLSGEYVLSEKIRANKELQSFIEKVKDLSYKSGEKYDYDIVSVLYANNTEETENLIRLFKDRGYVFINYSKKHGELSKFSEYEDYNSNLIIGREYDKVLMLLDSSFYYDKNGTLCGIPEPDEDYLYPNMFYQGITRARENIAIIVSETPTLFEKIVKILK